MAKKRPSVRKRERENDKRQRELKKSQKAADKRERRLSREQETSFPPREDADIAADRDDSDPRNNSD